MFTLYIQISAHFRVADALVAQVVERVLGKDEVTGSIPVGGSTLDSYLFYSRQLN